MRSGYVVAGRYRLDEVVGAGGMGAVWRATDLELRRVVAVKRATTGGGEVIRREARIGAGLQHPNVIAVFDSVLDGDERWLVMEYLPSRSLAEILRTDGPLSPGQAARVGVQIAAALAAMHARGIVHRDISPGNILITGDGTAKLTDLGIAIWANVTETGEERVGGTPGFVAAEVLAGHAATPASDMYSLGATVLAALEGRETPVRSLNDVLAALVNPDPARRPAADRARRLLLDVAGRRRGVRRMRVLGVAAGALVLVAATITVVTAVRARPATPMSGVELIGDARTADPCALVDEQALRHFGTTKVDRDYGEFNRCDVLIAVADDDESTARATVHLHTGPDDDTGEPMPNTDTIREIIETPDPEDSTCRRILLLPVRYRVVVSARYDDGRVPAPCTIADEMFLATKAKIGQASLPRRDAALDPALRPASLAGVDACSLLDEGDLSGLLGSGAGKPQPGFAGWNCAWFSPGRASRVVVEFDRVDLPAPEDSAPVRLPGRDGYVQAEGWGPRECLVAVRAGQYDSTDEDARKVEEARVYVRDDDTPEQRCATATTLATAIARRLPR